MYVLALLQDGEESIYVVCVVATTLVILDVPTVTETVVAGAVEVAETVARGNLDAQKLCAAGTPATSDATAPMTPEQAAETNTGVRREL